MKKILYILSAVTLMMTVSSCGRDDDFTDSIFDTSVPAVDPNKSTYEFDQWLYDNFTKPYNVEVQYQFNLPASDFDFQLAPADYNRSQLLAHFIRYLFYDVYTKYAGDEFMKMYGPRIFHFIGSSGYSPSTGTEILGLASGGVKITLYKINEMKPWSKGVNYTSDDLITLNENYFHTMHHEFSHILHQTKYYPVTFGQVTSGTYDPIDWHERDSVASHSMGYVTHYASSASYEDFVETISCIITDTDYRWMNRIINACAAGLRQGDKEEVLELVEKLNIDVDRAGAHWNNFTLYSEKEYNSETGEYDDTDRFVVDDHRSNETVINKAYTGYVPRFRYTAVKKFNSFKNDFIPWLSYSAKEDVAGINAILKKISIAQAWYGERWGLDAFVLRKEVAERQSRINEYLNSEVQIYDLK